MIMVPKHFILLAEDDEDDQELIHMAFNKVTSEHDIKFANNGQEALDILQRHSVLPCLIILDMNMPMMNGLQTLKALRSEPKFAKVPIVILTTSDREDIRKKSYTDGAADYFIKPVSFKDFVITAQKMLTYCR